ncbi:hypothetical protein [Marinivivus vitaminiproducens]|uniref:hypothetical protein n=1 Tax=Marinivivus vitaminiproducens TaxID=3035935 RepID=UPI00279E4EAD|nr:hypothetical protein P4R82_24895 [Geminicoccaceae bacterium SCSIO 64248]
MNEATQILPLRLRGMPISRATLDRHISLAVKFDLVAGTSISEHRTPKLAQTLEKHAETI